MAQCPECGQFIRELDYVVSHVQSYGFSLDSDCFEFYNWMGEGSSYYYYRGDVDPPCPVKVVSYSCPYCEHEVANNEGDAVAFLKGKSRETAMA